MIQFRVLHIPDVHKIQWNMLRSIEQGMNRLADNGVDFLTNTIKDWVIATKIYQRTTVKAGKWRFEIRHNSSTHAGRVYDWTNEGTRPHVIQPKGPYPLHFGVPHSPKSLAPGQSYPTGPAASVYTNIVHHPGTKARKFTDTLKDQYSKNGLLVNTVHEFARKGLQAR